MKIRLYLYLKSEITFHQKTFIKKDIIKSNKYEYNINKDIRIWIFTEETEKLKIKESNTLNIMIP